MPVTYSLVLWGEGVCVVPDRQDWGSWPGRSQQIPVYRRRRDRWQQGRRRCEDRWSRWYVSTSLPPITASHITITISYPLHLEPVTCTVSEILIFLQRTWLARDPFHAHCCRMGTAISIPVPDRVKLSFVIFDIGTLWRSGPERQSVWMYPYGNSGRQTSKG